MKQFIYLYSVMSMYHILMADVIKSSSTNLQETAAGLKSLCALINEKHKDVVVSPLTITLGDEFQGIIETFHTGMEIIIDLEEAIIRQQLKFKLRYVLLYGTITTPVNRKIAYEMLGEGLTNARNIINAAKKKDARFNISGYPNDNLFNKLFTLLQSFIDEWRFKDYLLIADFIEFGDYKAVALRNMKASSLMWKRKKTLKIDEYNILKSLLLSYD